MSTSIPARLISSKGHCDGCAIDGIGLFNDFMKQGLMADMNPIKIAYGDDRCFKWLDYLFYLIKNFHNVL
jgi:hypothetical protein